MLDGGWTRPGGGQGGRRFGILHLGSASNGEWAALESRSRRRGQRRRRWWSAGPGARASTDGRRTRSPRWRGRSRNDGSSPSANRGGGRDGERLTSSRAWRSTADTTCCGSPRSCRRRIGAAALGRDGEALAGHAVVETGTLVEIPAARRYQRRGERRREERRRGWGRAAVQRDRRRE